MSEVYTAQIRRRYGADREKVGLYYTQAAY
jgi:hypothetical protein